MQINQEKLRRQEEGIRKWLAHGGKGTFQHCTGMGKTFSACLIINKLLEKHPQARVLVVVPRINLRKQWIEELKEMGCKNTDVTVINTLVLRAQLFHYDLLILDEIHNYAADEFSKVFTYVNYRWILGLTATLARMDGKQSLLEEHAPIVDQITLHEARTKGWVANYLEFNLPVQLTQEDRDNYARMDAGFNKYFRRFGFDFELAMDCNGSLRPRPNYVMRQQGSAFVKVFDGWIDPPAVAYARSMGWEGNSAEEAREQENRNENVKVTKIGEKRNIWGEDTTHEWHPEKIVLYARKFGEFMRERKDFLHKAQAKVDAVVEVIERLNRKTISFSESVEFAKQVKERLGDRCVEYHSYMDSTDEEVTVTKGKKQITKAVHYGAKRLKERALKQITQGLDGIDCISTAKALDEGFNCPDLEVAAISSRTSNPRQQIQRIGRAARLFERNGVAKLAIIVNIYVQGTQDEKWLKNAQKGSRNIRHVQTIEEIERIIALELTPQGAETAA